MARAGCPPISLSPFLILIARFLSSMSFSCFLLSFHFCRSRVHFGRGGSVFWFTTSFGVGGPLTRNTQPSKLPYDPHDPHTFFCSCRPRRQSHSALLANEDRKSRVLFPCMFQRFGNSVQPSQVRSAGFLASEFGRCTHHGTHQRHRWLSVGGMPVETSRRAGDFTIVKTMMDSYWGPAFAYYWRNPTPAEERRKKKSPHTQLLRRRSQKIAVTH